MNPPVFHFNLLQVGDPHSDIVHRAITEGVQYSNEASAASKRRDYTLAATLHQKALALKLPAYGENSMQAAISMNGLGGTYIHLNRLDEAKEMLQKALRVREKMGPALDAACTRENIGALREAQGRWEEAAEVRRGAAAKEILCTYENCLVGMLGLADLKSCAACKASLYHSVECQKKDWRLRHKVLCQARKA